MCSKLADNRNSVLKKLKKFHNNLTFYYKNPLVILSQLWGAKINLKVPDRFSLFWSPKPEDQGSVLESIIEILNKLSRKKIGSPNNVRHV